MDPRFAKADEIGIRLELVRGLPTWEAAPAYRHQRAVDRIRSTIRRARGACSCVHVADVYIQFPDGSLKRPDISVFCREPDELDEPIRLVPEARLRLRRRGVNGNPATPRPKRKPGTPGHADLTAAMSAGEVAS